ncbi:MAG TPA: SidA/IucD/PvdA family monooxygenase, partial [Thermoanaerobaculia bacterium]|nr:SidA/IucD/PvdA family monooxygenase [Thermoanaerobaculia bacterium]
AVRPLPAADGGVELLEVVGRDAASGETHSWRARNLVVATGGRPWTPDGIDLVPGGRAFHARDFLHRMESDYPDRQAPYRFLVVGAGQSGAELFHYLATRYPNADVTGTMRRFGYKPVDESDFTNEIFFPEMTDFVFDLPDGTRQDVIASFRDVNYAVVDAPLIKKIYRFLYDEKVVGRDRARIKPLRHLRALREEGDRVVAMLEDSLDPTHCEEWAGDGVVLCTGFDWSNRHPLLDEIAPWLEETADGEGYRVDRDYGVAARDGFRPRVYLQGYCESTHGISETVLSLLPMRAQDIQRSLFERLAAARGVSESKSVPVAAAVEAG